jgi:hypothetical protein
LAFSCKRRYFCPSCHQKRVVEFGEWLCEEILKAVPHRHFTFSLPKILRRYFLYDRKLLSDLSRCAWDSLEVFLLSFPPKQETAPRAVIAIQTFGDFLLLRKGKITQEVAKLILSWRHSGFNVHCGPRIRPCDEEAMENIARYIIRASFSQERMTYLPDESQVLYRSKDGKNEKTFDALEWLAAM